MGTTSTRFPSGTVTFLFADIEGSTELLQAHPERYEEILTVYRAIATGAVERWDGSVVDHPGDGVFAAFTRAADAVRAAIEVRSEAAGAQWPNGVELRVRMGLHTGEPSLGAVGYVGIDVHRAVRIASAAHGGQILCSRATHELVEATRPKGVTLRDLGEHRLKDLLRSERLYQVDSSGAPREFPPIRSLEGYRHNLPLQANDIIGRDLDTEEIRRLLESKRLVTLFGPGGIGKTRLALDSAAGIVDRFRDGIWYVELAPLTDPELLAQTVAAVVGVREHSDSRIEDLLVEYLRSRELLVLLDNCEHLVEACASLTENLLRHCPGVRVLATSLEALGIAGEQVKRVPPLGVPSAEQTDLETIGRSEAVRLFVERARSLDESFDLGEGNAAALAEICRRLDGIPLAVELAASRTRLLSVEEIARRLDDRFRLLTGGRRTALPRQQTLKALIDWSYGLLSGSEQAMLRRLSVFCCGWTLDAAEAVCADGAVDSGEVLDLVAALIDKSLVVVEAGGGGTSYRLLETIRQYAQDRLLAEGEAQELRDRHLRYFLDLVERADSMLRGSEQQTWLSILDRHGDELRTALGWASERGLVEPFERLAVSMWRYWRVRSSFAEGRRWLEAAVASTAGISPDAPKEAIELRGRCLIGAGSLANYQGDYVRALAVLSEGLALCRRIGDEPGIANALAILAHSRVMIGDDTEAEEMLEESLAIFTRLERKRGVGYAKYCLGSLMVRREDYPRARIYLEEGLSLMEELEDSWWIENTLLELGWATERLGDHAAALTALERAKALGRSFNDRRGTARALMHIASVKLSAGNPGEAGASYRESLTLFSQIGDKWGIVSCIEGVAAAAFREEDGEYAVRLLGAAAKTRERLKSTVRALEPREHESLLEESKRKLGEAEYNRLFAEGRDLALEAAVSQALAKGQRARSDTGQRSIHPADEKVDHLRG